MTVAELTPYQNKSVILRLNDGEIAKAKVVFVFTEYEDMVVDIITTNRPDKYTRGISNAAYVIQASDSLPSKKFQTDTLPNLSSTTKRSVDHVISLVRQNCPLGADRESRS
jgi:hypothetical protein